MTLNGYIVERYTNMGGAYTCARLAEEARRAGMGARIVGVADVSLAKGVPELLGEPLPACDFVLNRYKHGHVKDRICSLARRAYNPCAPFDRFVDKYEQLAALPAGVEAPDWVLGHASDGFDALAARLGAPFVAKGLTGSMGDQVSLVEGPEGLAALRARHGASAELLFERFVARSRGRDLRVFVVRGEVVACMERRSADDFRSNVALGAQVRAWPADQGIRDWARRLTDATGLDFFGLDLLFGEDGYLFCELNVMPGLQGIEEATGVNVAALIIDLIRGDLS